MKTTPARFSKHTLTQFAYISKSGTLEWKPDLTRVQRKAILDELKSLVKGSVVYFKSARLPDGSYGEAYLTPKSFKWIENTIYVDGDVVYVSKGFLKGLCVAKTTDLNYLVPEIVVRTIPFKVFNNLLADLFKRLTPTPKF